VIKLTFDADPRRDWLLEERPRPLAKTKRRGISGISPDSSTDLPVRSAIPPPNSTELFSCPSSWTFAVRSLPSLSHLRDFSGISPEPFAFLWCMNEIAHTRKQAGTYGGSVTTTWTRSSVAAHMSRHPHAGALALADQTPRDLSDFSPPASWTSDPSPTSFQWVARKIPQIFFPSPYLGLRANGPAFSPSSIRFLSNIYPPICLSGVMNIEVRNSEEEEEQGIAATDDPVPRDHAGSRSTAGCGSGQGMGPFTALHGRAGGTVSSPLRTLGHLMGRSARSDLGADENCATSEDAQGRYLTIVSGRIDRGGELGERSVSRRGSGA
jgi:hypothetical protein